MPELKYPKQEEFCHQYLVDLNGTQAAIRAKYSPNAANVKAAQLLAKVNVQERISELRKQLSQDLRITPERVLKELATIGFLDIRRAFGEDGKLLPIKNMPEDVARAIGGIDVSTLIGKDKDAPTIENIHKIKVIDKKGALELLGKNLALFTENVKVSGELTLAHVVLARKKKQQAEKIDNS